MSRLRKKIMKCQHCHQEGEYDLWTSANVDYYTALVTCDAPAELRDTRPQDY